MSAEEASPLLGGKGKAKANVPDADSLSESTPLLTSSSATPRYDGEQDDHQGDVASVTSRISAPSTGSTKRRQTPWPSIIAIIALAILAIGIMFCAFFVPAAVEEYAKRAAVLEPTNLSIESITSNGVRARIQANFRLDGSRVSNDNARRIGRATTWVVRTLGTDETNLTVYLPDYNQAILGSAVIPPLTISIVDGHNTAIDVIAELAPGEADGIRNIVNDWLDGKLERLRVTGKANISLKSGIIPLGIHPVAESMVFEGQSLYRSFASLYFGEKVFF
jgi:hypothetical protein